MPYSLLSAGLLTLASLLILPLFCYASDNPSFSAIVERLREQGIFINYSSDLLDNRDPVELDNATATATMLEQLQHWLTGKGLFLRQIGPTRYLITHSGKPKPVVNLIQGRVVDAISGAPVDGASVRLLSMETVTDSEGAFTLGVPAARDLVLNVEAGGYTSLTFPYPAGSKPLTLRLTPLIETLEVTGSRHPVYRHGLNRSFSADAEELALAPATGDDKLRLITQLPGSATNGISARPQVRGGRQDEVLVLLDGMTLLEPFHFKDFQSLFSVVDAGILEEATFHSGAFQVPFGNRMSGVLDLHTRENNGEDWNRLALSLFNLNYSFAGADAGNRNQWLGWLRRSSLQWLVPHLDNNNLKLEMYDSFLRFDHRPNESLMLRGNLLTFRDEISFYDAEEKEYASSFYDNFYAWFNLEKNWNPQFDSKTLLSVSEIRNSRDGELNRESVVTAKVEDSRHFRQITLEQFFDWSGWHNHQLSTGFGAKAGKAEYDYTRSSRFDPLYASVATELPPGQIDVNVAADVYQGFAFVRDRQLLNEQWVAEWGLRWDWQKYEKQFSDAQWSLRANLLYQPSDTLSYRFALGRFTQAQELNELPVEDGIARFYSAQVAYHTVLGVTLLPAPGLKWEAELYYKQLEDQHPFFDNLFNRVEILPEALPDRQEQVARNGRARGLELGFEFPLPWDQEGWLNYSFAEVEDDIEGRYIPRNWDQRHSINTGTRGRWGKWDYQLRYSYHTGWPTTEFELITTADNQQALVIGPRNRNHLAHYASLDFHLSRQISLPASHLEFYVDIINLLGRNNEAGRSFTLARTDSEIVLEPERENSFSIMPNLGLIWEF
ncbi:TonB-dependent receptor [Sedimenticola sp.]|uniref:TonB-dependent receptor n=1 Tax=Sedimenticola sp. TaxID=1940285 RepID=UPI003D111C69